MKNNRITFLNPDNGHNNDANNNTLTKTKSISKTRSKNDMCSLKIYIYIYIHYIHKFPETICTSEFRSSSRSTLIHVTGPLKSLNVETMDETWKNILLRVTPTMIFQDIDLASHCIWHIFRHAIRHSIWCIFWQSICHIYININIF